MLVGTVTVLFTDLEGSTRMWQADGVAMQPPSRGYRGQVPAIAC